jgi:hypothetical protein
MWRIWCCLSKHGKEAKRFFRESFIKFNSEIKPGNKIFGGINGNSWIVVKAIEDDKLNGSYSMCIITDKLKLRTNKNSTSEVLTYEGEWEEKHKAAIEYQSKLTKKW